MAPCTRWLVALFWGCTPAPAAHEASSGGEREASRPGAAPAPVQTAGPAAAREGSPPPAPVPPSTLRVVFMNGVRLSGPDLAELGAVFGQEPLAGRYFYDAESGLWGLEQHGAGGVTRPGLRSPAPLDPAASRGATGVFVNGRELPPGELVALAALLRWPDSEPGAYAGRYRLDAEGGVYSAQGRYLGNAADAARRASQSASPSAARCAWFQLHEARGAFGQNVTLSCD